MRPAVKLISTVLLQVLTLVPVLYLYIIQFHQQSIRDHIKERLEKEKMQTIVLHEEEIKWAEPGKEIIIGNNYFDIETITETGNGLLLITGIYDIEETSLVEEMKKNNQEENSKGYKLVKLAQLMTAIPNPDSEQNPDLYIHRNWSITADNRIVSLYLNILTPPPQLSC